jgi:hypothetical protein
MKRSALVLVMVGAVAFLVGGPLQAETSSPWIHVQVDEAGDDSSKVRVNLPLSVVQAALRLAPDKIMSDGHFHLRDHGHDLSVEDMRRVWTELRASGEAEWVSVEEKDQTVHVARRGDVVQVRVEEPGDGEQVLVEVPIAVVDALFSGEGESLNLEGAVEELANLRGDIVRVDEEDTKVRIWIDEKD